MQFTKHLLFILAFFILPTVTLSAPRLIHVEWEYQNIENLAGYRLYLEDNLVHTTTNPNATSIDCTVEASDGEASFSLTSYFKDGTESAQSESYIYIFSKNLKAVLSADALHGSGPLHVTFDATSSTGNILSYFWKFGDGQTGNGSTVSHTFTSAGNYTVKLLVTDNIGATDEEIVQVVVTDPSNNNLPPIAKISLSESIGNLPLKVFLDGAASFDKDGTIVKYEWDLGDGNKSTGSRITYTYTSVGTFYPKLTVTDNHGSTNSISAPIIVKKPKETVNIPPIAIITASANRGNRPLAISFNANKSNDPDGVIKKYLWNFGDGNTSSSVSVKHIFTKSGVYTVTLMVTDNMGKNSQTAFYKITVLDEDSQKMPIPDLRGVYYLLLKD